MDSKPAPTDVAKKGCRATGKCQDCSAYAEEPLHTVGLLEAAHQYSLQDMCGSASTPAPGLGPRSRRRSQGSTGSGFPIYTIKPNLYNNQYNEIIKKLLKYMIVFYVSLYWLLHKLCFILSFGNLCYLGAAAG